MKKYLFMSRAGLYGTDDLSLDPTLELIYDTSSISANNPPSSSIVKYNSDIYFEYNKTYYTDLNDNVSVLETSNYGQMVVANNNLFKLYSGSDSIKRRVGSTWDTLQVGVVGIDFYDIKYSNGTGKYYIVASNKHIYITSDFTTYEDFDLSGVLGSSFTVIDVDNNYIYIMNNRKLRIYDLATLTIVTTVFDVLSSGSIPFITRKGDYLYGLNVTASSDYYYQYFTAFRIYIGTLDYEDFVIETGSTYTYTGSYYSAGESFSDNSRYYWFTDNKATKKIIYSGTKGALVVDYSAETFSSTPLFTLEQRQIVGSVYKELHVTYSGAGYEHTSNADNEENGVLYNDLDKNFQITINPLTHYVIDSITSVNGVVNENTITYTNSDLYLEDTINVSTHIEYNINGGFDLSSIDDDELTTDFNASVLGYTIYNGTYFEIEHLICENGVLSFYDGDRTHTIYENGSIVEGWTGIIVGDIERVSGEMYSYLTSHTLNSYYRDVTFNEPEYDDGISSYNRTLSEPTHIIQTVDTYFVYSTGQMRITYAFFAKEGYKVDEIECLYGTQQLNALVITALDDYAEIDIRVITGGDDFKIILYNCSDSKIYLYKRLLNGYTTTGNLTENASILTPSVIFELSGVPNYNYCYISAFNRYYFITNVVNVGFKLWRIDLKVDVLMTYRNKLALSERAFVRRGIPQSEYYNERILPKLKLLQDDRIPISNYVKEDAFNLSDYYGADLRISSLISETHPSFSYTPNVNLSTATFVVIIGNFYSWRSTVSESDVHLRNVQPPTLNVRPYTNSCLPQYDVENKYNNVAIVVIKGEVNLQLFLKALSNQGVDDSIMSIKMYPFPILKTCYTVSGDHYVLSTVDANGILNACNGVYELDIAEKTVNLQNESPLIETFNIYITCNNVTDYIRYCAFKMPKLTIGDNFDVYKRYNLTKYMLHIPYGADVELNSSDILENIDDSLDITEWDNPPIYLHYSVDLVTSVASYTLSSTRYETIEVGGSPVKIYSPIILSKGMATLGVDIPFSKENLYEIQKKGEAITTNAITGIFASALVAIAGTLATIPTGGSSLPAVAMGVAGVGASVSNLIAQNKTLKPSYNYVPTSGYTSMTDYTEVILLTKTNDILVEYPSYYDNNGYVINRYDCILYYGGHIEADISDVSISDITKTEFDELNELLNKGVYYILS